ncbi:DUF2239 family protein [Ferrovibrio xuzhouensis]|uniref:DUF2239 family protein n=1 Tax=Ferrovibrio xuzhouensis TaxID=1576914 RepID=A0ABV7VG85_9PROT
MTDRLSIACTAFEGPRLLAAGPLSAVALAVKAAGGGGLVFEDATGRVIDLDLRGSDAEILARLQPSAPAAEPRGRGRPKLGVTAREVTLLPRHWDWLAAQPGGASVALRKLVEQAMRDGRQTRRVAQEAAYRVMTALAGDLPGYEEAIRALFAGDSAGLATHSAGWPADIRTYVTRLAFNRETP